MIQLKNTITLVLETCCNCGVSFGLNEDHKKNLLQNANTFHCPNGHPQSYTRKQTLEEKLEVSNKKIQELSCRLNLCEDQGIDHFVDWKAAWANRLRDAGVTTIGKALELGESGLQQIYGIGDSCIETINHYLSDYNVSLKY